MVIQCVFVFLWKCYFKNRATKFPYLPHGKKISTGILKMLKGLSIPGSVFDFIWFLFFSLCPLSLSFLSHWFCDRVPIYLFIFIPNSLAFLCGVLDTVTPQKTEQQQHKRKLFILEGSWHRTNKSVSMHTMYLCHPLLLFFSPLFLIQVTGFFLRWKQTLFSQWDPSVFEILPAVALW